MRRARVSLGVFVVSATVGCGGSGDGEGRLSREDLVKRGNAICARYQARFDKLPQPRNLREYRTYMTKAIPLARGELNELSRLEPAAEDQRSFDQLLANARQTVNAAVRLRRAAADGSQAELELLFEHAQQLGVEGDAIARELGLHRCIDRQ